MPEWYRRRQLAAIVAKASTGKMLEPREMAALRRARGEEAEMEVASERLDAIVLKAANGKVLTNAEKVLLREAMDGSDAADGDPDGADAPPPTGDFPGVPPAPADGGKSGVTDAPQAP